MGYFLGSFLWYLACIILRTGLDYINGVEMIPQFGVLVVGILEMFILTWLERDIWVLISLSFVLLLVLSVNLFSSFAIFLLYKGSLASACILSDTSIMRYENTAVLRHPYIALFRIRVLANDQCSSSEYA